jgi:ornithine carbamoyltransferase
MEKAQASMVLHCQPAHLEEEITTELFDSPLSKVFQQAENRMWAQNAVLVTLFSQKPPS